MKNILKYEDWVRLNEGGWATVKTQGTAITPKIIGSVVKVIQKISKEFNEHLRELDLPSLDFIKPIGSGTWWSDDQINNPNKEYGDVDFLVAYPTLKLTEKGEREDEIATVKLYNRELLMLLEVDKFEDVDVKESKAVSTDSGLKLIVKVPTESQKDGWVQVDLVVTHKEYSDWTAFRMTPIRNVKGFVLGNLYSSFGEVLDLSIQVRGVRAKFDGEVMKPYSKRTGVEDRMISANSESFMVDICKFFWEQSGTDKPFKQTSIEKWKGMDKKSPKFEDLIDGIKLAASTLSQLGEFGTTIKYKSESEFLKAVVNRYEKKMMTAYNSPKFNKAESPAAIEAMNKIRSLIEEYVQKAKDLLK